MTNEELRKLRGYYHSLVGLQQVLAGPSSNPGIVLKETAQLIQEEFDRIYQDIPGLLPSLNIERHRLPRDPNLYRKQGILSMLALAVGKLKVAVDTPESTPVTQSRQFSFVKDASLRQIIERDYVEIQKAYVASCWKSVIILCGGTIEAILTDLLVADEPAAKGSAKAPNKGDISKWDLADLINVGVDLLLVKPGVEKLSHSVREYRNLVHPGNEIRNKLTFDEEEARIAIEVLHMLHRDLSP